MYLTFQKQLVYFSQVIIAIIYNNIFDLIFYSDFFFPMYQPSMNQKSEIDINFVQQIKYILMNRENEGLATTRKKEKTI